MRLPGLILAGLAATLPAPSVHAGETDAAGTRPGLAIHAEARLRHVAARNARLVKGDDAAQAQFRGIVGADLRPNRHLRFFGELGTGQVDRDRDSTSANFQNAASLQQLFVDVHAATGPLLLGATAGRQEFADGPRQLVSVGDGPNLHRTWNGLRLYARAPRFDIGAFDLRATRLVDGSLGGDIQHATVLRGVNASVVVSRGQGKEARLDPFWLHTASPWFRIGDETGNDRRDTFGLRFRGGLGAARWDWTAARQSGRTLEGRRIDAWGIFAVQSFILSDRGWKPRLTSHIDVASGGGVDDGGTLRNFHPLYASSSYLGEGQYLALSNLFLVAPGIALAPSANTTLAFEYGRARRLDARDDVYGGGNRPYAGTASVGDGHVGDLLRLMGTWSPSPRLSLAVGIEYLASGRALREAGFGSGSFAQFSTTYRY